MKKTRRNYSESSGGVIENTSYYRAIKDQPSSAPKVTVMPLIQYLAVVKKVDKSSVM